MNIISSIRTALSSIWRNKLTSLLAVLGVVIGVTSVSTLVSVGQGLKNDVSGLIQGMGTNVVAIIAGKIDTNNMQSSGQANPAAFISGDILTLNDISSIEKMDSIEAVSPISLVAGELKNGDKKTSITTVGVFPSILKAMQVIQLDKGEMFPTSNNDKVIVLSSTASKDLFGDEDPIGKTIQIGKTDGFKVVGTLKESKSSAAFASDVNTITFIPMDAATDLNKGKVQIMRVVAKAKDSANVADVKKQITTQLIANHGGEEDFTVMTQDDLLGLVSQFLNMATALVSAIAAISVIVGGIGIMNIMLVAVTERTREIGIRKAVGATNGAILSQFLIESIVITSLGGAIGLVLTFIIGAVIKVKTSLTPAITPEILIFAVALSIGVGIIFGLVPALRAARKNPVEALRYE